MVSDSGDYCKRVLLNDIPVNKITDINSKKLTDKHLCETLGTYLNLPVYGLYKKVCGFVHFSSSSFHSITKAEKDWHITMLVRILDEAMEIAVQNGKKALRLNALKSNLPAQKMYEKQGSYTGVNKDCMQKIQG